MPSALPKRLDTSTGRTLRPALLIDHPRSTIETKNPYRRLGSVKEAMLELVKRD
jgi:hypothetical protein